MKSPVRSPRASLVKCASCLILSAALVCGLSAPDMARAQAITNTSLYYRLGGSSPFGGTLNKSQLALNLGLSVRLNYSCGKFDLGASWTNLMNQIQQLGQTITSAIQAGIAALPAYIIQRATPGLWQIFTTYSAKADLLIAAGLKNCQQMEAEIKAGGNPYADFVKAAQNMQWGYEIKQGNKDLLKAQENIFTNNAGQKAGLPWVFGVPAGGKDQSPIKPVYDLAVAGYQITCGAPPNANGATASTCPSSARLAQIFGTPDALGTWSKQVLGDKVVYTCDQNDCAAQSTATNAGTPAIGLLPKLQDEINFVTPIMATVLADPAQSAQLAQIAVPGFAMSPHLMESIRRMSPDEQPVVLGRLVNELALHRVVEKALMTRSVLLTGLTIPEAAKVPEAQKDVQTKLDHLTRFLDDLLYEWRVRKEITSNTAMTVLRDSAWRDSLGAALPPGAPADNTLLINGAPVTVNPAASP